ncbi:MAG: hypothetical protein AAB267_04055, partial [Candidatus Desantisbacteria bacterium]
MNFSVLEDAIEERMAPISSRITEIGTASAIDPHQVFNQSKKQQPSYIFHIKIKKFYAPKPISVKCYREEDLFFAENENLCVCGTGDTREEALHNLSLHLIYFFDYYKKLDE